jgi:hypothetical protein
MFARHRNLTVVQFIIQSAADVRYGVYSVEEVAAGVS